MRAIFLALIFLCCPGGLARADVPAAGASCAGDREGASSCYKNGCYTCTSGVWQAQPMNIGNTATSCSSGVAGLISWDGDSFNLCDGTAWVAVSTQPTTTPPMPPAGAAYFVLSAGSWTGNLGGISGANSKCQSDLSSNSWMNKPVAFDSSKVKAFICDAANCNALTPNATYYYATAGDATKGGAYFTANSSGQGPNDTYGWDAANRFGVVAEYWSNQTTQSTSLFGVLPNILSLLTTCSGWSSASLLQTGKSGISSTSGSGRWDAATPLCSASNRLICVYGP